MSKLEKIMLGSAATVIATSIGALLYVAGAAEMFATTTNLLSAQRLSLARAIETCEKIGGNWDECLATRDPTYATARKARLCKATNDVGFAPDDFEKEYQQHCRAGFNASS